MSPRDWHEAWGAVAQDALARAVCTLPPTPAPGILDVGAGMGMAWPALSALGGRVTAIEADAELVTASRPHATSLSVALHHADVLDWLEPGDARYGLIWAGDVLWCNYFPDPQVIVQRLMQALVPGGVLAVFTGNWYASRFLWGYPDLERAVLRVNARRWRVPPDATLLTMNARLDGWSRRAEATCARRSIRCSAIVMPRGGTGGGGTWKWACGPTTWPPRAVLPTRALFPDWRGPTRTRQGNAGRRIVVSRSRSNHMRLHYVFSVKSSTRLFSETCRNNMPDRAGHCSPELENTRHAPDSNRLARCSLPARGPAPSTHLPHGATCW